jgi:tryptophan 2,3-dioxygenase
MKKTKEDIKPAGLYYADYLQLDKVIGAQKLESAKGKIKGHPKGHHDEMLFIIVHQVYELWFKQILHELSFISGVFNQSFIAESELSQAVAKADRIISIQNLLMQQIDVLETMTPMDFLEFRHLLVPASGFQSVQFREIEIRMGLSTNKRFSVDRHYFLGRLSTQHRKHLEKVETEKSLIQLLEEWLVRMPFTQEKQFDFWKSYKQSVEEMMKQEKFIIESVPHFQKAQKEAQLVNFESTKTTFEMLFDQKKWMKLQKEGKKKLGQKATLNALFIMLYREAPILNMPFRLLTSLMNIDENFTTWRYRHALLAKRMLGSKVGTGGSSGHQYLKNAADHNRVFEDFFNLSTFIIPRQMLPKLPKALQKSMDFHFTR